MIVRINNTAVFELLAFYARIFITQTNDLVNRLIIGIFVPQINRSEDSSCKKKISESNMRSFKRNLRQLSRIRRVSMRKLFVSPLCNVRELHSF